MRVMDECYHGAFVIARVEEFVCRVNLKAPFAIVVSVVAVVLVSILASTAGLIFCWVCI